MAHNELIMTLIVCSDSNFLNNATNDIRYTSSERVVTLRFKPDGHSSPLGTTSLSTGDRETQGYAYMFYRKCLNKPILTLSVCCNLEPAVKCVHL